MSTFTMFALVAEGDVFHVMAMADDHPTAIKWTAALRSGIKFINATEYASVKTGFLYSEGNFYATDDESLLLPLEKEKVEPETLTRYAGVVDKEIIGFYSMDSNEMPVDIINLTVAGLESDPEVVEFPQELGVEVGWTWDGETFKAPGA